MYWGCMSARLVLVLFLQWDRMVTLYSLAGSVMYIRAFFYFYLKYMLTIGIKIRFRNALQNNAEHFIS